MSILRITVWVLGALLALALGQFVLITVASERVEVVELHTLDQGKEVTTRLWIVDDEGLQYLRVGHDGSGWFSRIEASEDIALTRNNQRANYTVALRPDKSEQINQLMQAKYTWGDSLIAIMTGGRAGSIAIELHPVAPAARE